MIEAACFLLLSILAYITIDVYKGTWAILSKLEGLTYGLMGLAAVLLLFFIVVKIIKAFVAAKDKAADRRLYRLERNAARELYRQERSAARERKDK